MSLEEFAASAVVAVTEGGRNHVELRVGQGVPVCVCGHANPAVVREQAEAIRHFLAAAIHEDRQQRVAELAP
jgi:hypothetical protein